jgi:hypothetical protein
MKSAGFLPRQLGTEESWQVSLKIHPAIVAQCDLALRTEAGVGGSDRHSEQNPCWLGTLFTGRMTTEHGGAHALRLLHRALSFQSPSCTERLV